MAIERELTCIRCPLGCQLKVTGEIGMLRVSGNTCPRGAEYGVAEVSNPTRVVTSSVTVEDGELARVPVKTKGDIPKGKIFDCMEEILKCKVTAPVAIGDVLIENCAGTGIDIVATRDIKKAG